MVAYLRPFWHDRSFSHHPGHMFKLLLTRNLFYFVLLGSKLINGGGRIKLFYVAFQGCYLHIFLTKVQLIRPLGNRQEFLGTINTKPNNIVQSKVFAEHYLNSTSEF